MHAHAITLQASPHAHLKSIQLYTNSTHQPKALHSEQFPQYAQHALADALRKLLDPP